jgi:hypothetical protein
MATIPNTDIPTPIPALAPVESELDGCGSVVSVAVGVDWSAVVEMGAVEMERVEELVVEVVLVVDVLSLGAARLNVPFWQQSY